MDGDNANLVVRPPMYRKQNLHTHSIFCDGKDCPEEIIEAALQRGFDSIGFSIHSHLECQDPEIVTLDKIGYYNNEIQRLKEKYDGCIDIYRGIEYDIYSDHAASGYDYTIASVHYLNTVEGKRTFDVGLAGTLEFINRYFSSDPMSFAKTYYEAVASIPDFGQFDIIGHFDLITKNNEIGKFIDVTAKSYRDYALEAIHALKGKIPAFEVNTGAISRGYRTTPYPTLELMKEFFSQGFGVVIASDCHNKNYIDGYFDEAKSLLREAGYKTQMVLTRDGFLEVPL